jgi:MFS family permease
VTGAAPNDARLKYGILALVTSAQAGASVGQQALGSLGPFFAPAFNLDAAQLGVIFGAVVFGAATTTALAGIFVDAFGERKMILFSGATICFALLAAVSFRSYPWLVFWVGISGVGYAASTPAGGRAILLWFTRDRGFAMGIRQMGVPIGGIVGAVLLPFLASAFDYRVALAAAGLLALLPAVAVAIYYRDPEEVVRRVRPRRELLASMASVARDPRLVLVTLTGMILIFGQSNMLTFLELSLVRDTNLTIALGAAALAVAQIGAASGRVMWGSASDRLFGGDRVVPLMFASFALCAASLGVAHLPVGGVLPAFVLAFVLGLSGAGWNGIFSTALAEIGGPERTGSAIGVGLTGLFLAGTISPPLFGAIADAHGFSVAWTALGLFALLALIPAFFARRAIHRTPFV